MKELRQRLMLLAIFLVLLSTEHVIGLPVLTITFAVFLFVLFPPNWRYIVYSLGGFALAVVYGAPFWLSFFVFAILWTPVEFWPFSRQSRNFMIGCMVLSAVLAIAITTGYQLTFAILPVLFCDVIILALFGIVSLRQRTSVSHYV